MITLTVKIKNDNNWSKVKATQGVAASRSNHQERQHPVDVVPNAGDVVVSNGSDGVILPPESSSSTEGAGILF